MLRFDLYEIPRKGDSIEPESRRWFPEDKRLVCVRHEGDYWWFSGVGSFENVLKLIVVRVTQLKPLKYALQIVLLVVWHELSLHKLLYFKNKGKGTFINYRFRKCLSTTKLVYLENKNFPWLGFLPLTAGWPLCPNLSWTLLLLAWNPPALGTQCTPGKSKPVIILKVAQVASKLSLSLIHYKWLDRTFEEKIIIQHYEISEKHRLEGEINLEWKFNLSLGIDNVSL